jgi:hypothetical protein
MLWLVSHSVRRARGWGNPECEQRITEVCPYICYGRLNRMPDLGN